jgi:DNA-directed RNA polymerase subunit RPC12/RpoP
MRGYRCPGQLKRDLQAELYRCPGCSYQVEIFSDELRVRCPRCGREVYGKKNLSCIDWCKAAEQCLGSDARRQSKGKKG